MQSPDPREVLIADADASIQGLLAAVVTRCHGKPVVVSEGRRALYLLRSRRFDAAIVDLLLPDLHGEKLLQEVANEDEAAIENIIVLTTTRWTPPAPLAKVAAVLRKPFILQELVSALEACRARKENPAISREKR